MRADNLVVLRCHGGFYTGVISHCHHQWVYKESVSFNMTRIGVVITIWDEVSCKLRVSFDGMVTRKKVLSDFNHRIDTNIDVFVEVLEVQSSVSFELCLDEEFI